MGVHWRPVLAGGFTLRIGRGRYLEVLQQLAAGPSPAPVPVLRNDGKGPKIQVRVLGIVQRPRAPVPVSYKEFLGPILKVGELLEEQLPLFAR